MVLVAAFSLTLASSGSAQSSDSAGAKKPAQDPILSWLFGPPAQAETQLKKLVAKGVAAPLLDALRPPKRLAPGYHRISLPGWDPPLLYVVLVPKAPTIDGKARPAIVTPAPGGKAPHEFALRAIFGGALEAGICVISPVPPLQHGYPVPQPARRNPFRAQGRILLNKIVADAHRRTSFDRDRVVFVNKFYPTTGDSITLDGPNLEITPFAGSLWICPLNSRIRLPVSPRRWQERFMLAIHGEHPSELLLRRIRSARLPPFMAKTRLIQHGGLNWAGEFTMNATPWRQLLLGVERRHFDSGTEVHVRYGDPHPLRHEWVWIPELKRALVVKVRHRGNTLEISTPEATRTAPIAMDLFLSHAKGAKLRSPAPLSVQWNGRALSPESVQDGKLEQAWRKLQYRALSGRTCDRYVAIRPRP